MIGPPKVKIGRSRDVTTAFCYPYARTCCDQPYQMWNPVALFAWLYYV